MYAWLDSDVGGRSVGVHCGPTLVDPCHVSAPALAREVGGTGVARVHERGPTVDTYWTPSPTRTWIQSSIHGPQVIKFAVRVISQKHFCDSIVSVLLSFGRWLLFVQIMINIVKRQCDTRKYICY